MSQLADFGTAPGSYEFDDDPARIDRDAAWAFLSTDAYWHRWRVREDFEKQADTAWRLIGVYEATTGSMIGFARAVSDGVAFAYLADVYVLPEHRGHDLGKHIMRAMVDDGPGSGFRWVLATRDAHGLYEQFGFGAADDTIMVRRGEHEGTPN
jgi:GNAT superfamily N-acetyltransferase